MAVGCAWWQWPQVRHVGSRAAVGSCLPSLFVFPSGAHSLFLPVSSFSPERIEAILSGWQSLSLRGLKADLSKTRKQMTFNIASSLSLKHVRTRVTDHCFLSACRPLSGPSPARLFSPI